MPLAVFPRFVDEIALVSDKQLAERLEVIAQTAGQIAERTGVAAMGAATTKRDELAGEIIGIILSCGHITIEQLSRILNKKAL
jgi:threonine dehydratase